MKVKSFKQPPPFPNKNQSQMDLWEEIREIFIKDNNALKYLSENFYVKKERQFKRLII